MMIDPTIRRTDSDRRTERNCQSNCWTQPPVRSAKKVTMWERKTNSSSNSNGSKVENGNAGWGGKGEWERKRGEKCELAKLESG